MAVSSRYTILDSIESWLFTPGVTFGGPVLPLGALPAISGTELVGSPTYIMRFGVI